MPAGGVAALKTYTARARRWEGGWELHIDGVGVTQSRTLRDADRMARSYIAMDTGADRDSFDVDIVPDLDELEKSVGEARRAVVEAAKVQREAAALARQVVRDLRTYGLSGNDIAALLKVSPQRVSQILKSGSTMEASAKTKATPTRTRARA